MTTNNSDGKPSPANDHGKPQLQHPSDSVALSLPRSIAGPMRVVSRDVSPDERAAAKRALEAIESARSRAPQNPALDPNAPSPEDIGAKLSGPDRKRPKLDDILGPGLADAGYRKVAKLTYRGE